MQALCITTGALLTSCMLPVPRLDRNIAAARSANVLVTVHGSGSNNAILMEEGSTLIEVRPYEFGTRAHAWANFFMPKVRRRLSAPCYGFSGGRKGQYLLPIISVCRRSACAACACHPL